MWGSNDDSRVKAELERRKKDDERRAKIAKERSEKAFKAKEARKLKKVEDEKKAAELEKKRKEGREEADKATDELLGNGGAGQTAAPQIPTLTRAGYGSGFSSFSSLHSKTELTRGGGKYMPPGSTQPGVNQQFGKDSGASDQYAHRQGGDSSPPPPPPGPRLSRPF